MQQKLLRKRLSTKRFGYGGSLQSDLEDPMVKRQTQFCRKFPEGSHNSRNTQRILSLKFEHVSDWKYPTFNEVFPIIGNPFPIFRNLFPIIRNLFVIIGNSFPFIGNPFLFHLETFSFVFNSNRNVVNSNGYVSKSIGNKC